MPTEAGAFRQKFFNGQESKMRYHAQCCMQLQAHTHTHTHTHIHTMKNVCIFLRMPDYFENMENVKVSYFAEMFVGIILASVVLLGT
jgi:hypothetical protein